MTRLAALAVLLLLAYLARRKPDVTATWGAWNSPSWTRDSDAGWREAGW